MLRRTTADGLQGAARCCAVCSDDLWPIGRWRVEGRRMLRRKQADGAWRAGELPAEGAQGLYLARKSYSPFRQKGYSSGETGLLSIIPSYLKKSVDEDRANEDTNFRCETRRYLSWIEGLTTNQYVGGSNPSRRTILDRSEQNRSRLERFFFCQAKERNVLEGSKIETSQYVDFRLLASARSSEGTTAEHQPSPWAPLRLRSHRQRPAHAAPPRCTDAHRTEERTCSIFLK